MWTRVITLCWLLLLVIDTNAHTGGGKDDEYSDYEIHDLHDTEIAGNKEHLKEHLDYMSEDALEKMTDDEIEFHFFNSHDYNKDLRLDGLEILSSLAHSFTEEHIVGDPPSAEQLKTMSDEQIKKLNDDRNEQFMDFLTNLIDEVLSTSDKDNDGYLDYFEYVHAREHQRELNEGRKTEHNKKHKHVKGKGH